MPSLRLRSDLRHCTIGRHIICLDLRESRYFLLEGYGAEAFCAAVSDDASGAQMNWLTSKGLTEPGKPGSVWDAALPPETSVYDESLPVVRMPLVAEAIVTQWRARRRLARRPLSSLLLASDLAATTSECYLDIAAAFIRASRYRDATDQCLARGLAIRAMLARRGLGCDLVLGVTLPFAAHCWIQTGSLLLSDPLDHILNYRPLMTVR